MLGMVDQERERPSLEREALLGFSCPELVSYHSTWVALTCRRRRALERAIWATPNTQHCSKPGCTL